MKREEFEKYASYAGDKGDELFFIFWRGVPNIGGYEQIIGVRSASNYWIDEGMACCEYSPGECMEVPFSDVFSDRDQAEAVAMRRAYDFFKDGVDFYEKKIEDHRAAINSKIELLEPMKTPSGWKANRGWNFFLKNSKHGIKYKCKHCGREQLGTNGQHRRMHLGECPYLKLLIKKGVVDDRSGY